MREEPHQLGAGFCNPAHRNTPLSHSYLTAHTSAAPGLSSIPAPGIGGRDEPAFPPHVSPAAVNFMRQVSQACLVQRGWSSRGGAPTPPPRPPSAGGWGGAPTCQSSRGSPRSASHPAPGWHATAQSSAVIIPPTLPFTQNHPRRCARTVRRVPASSSCMRMSGCGSEHRRGRRAVAAPVGPAEPSPAAVAPWLQYYSGRHTCSVPLAAVGPGVAVSAPPMAFQRRQVAAQGLPMHLHLVGYLSRRLSGWGTALGKARPGRRKCGVATAPPGRTERNGGRRGRLRFKANLGAAGRLQQAACCHAVRLALLLSVKFVRSRHWGNVRGGERRQRRRPRERSIRAREGPASHPCSAQSPL